MATVSDIEANASECRRNKRWAEARTLYQELLHFALTPMDRAKVLANIAQMYGEEGLTSQAIVTAEETLRLVHDHRLDQTNEGIHLRGFMKGRLRRWRGEPLPWQLPVTIASPYLIGAAVGAAVGSKVHTTGLLGDVRYGLSCVGAIFGFFALAPLAARWPRAAALGMFLSTITLGYLLFENKLSAGLVTLCVLLTCFLFLCFRFSGPK